MTRKREPTYGNYRHGATTQRSKSPEYIVWSAMHDRCRNPNNKRFARYGGRGISVCERWWEFPLFLEDMGLRPQGHSIERINNDGNYEPENCRWATRVEQAANQAHSRLITAFGRTLTVSAWGRELGIERTTIRDRLKRGLSPEEALR